MPSAIDREDSRDAPIPADATRPVLRVAVAGASGFVGRALLPALGERHSVRALGRNVSEEADEAEPDDQPGVRWRRCDLFSLLETEESLAGVDVAIYLVHSMMPSARLTQGGFRDLDLLLADNFGRAAGRAGVKRILYLGGLVPENDDDELSEHLASRVEVESALGVLGVPVTALRAGLVVGRGGSSLQILARLVGRLPVMVTPAWTASKCQPIALDDVVAILVHCVEDDATTGEVCDVGGPDILSYREMMQETARVLGKKRTMIPVPLFTPGLSRLWVSLVTQLPKALVAPLIQSLRHDMVARDRWVQDRMGLQTTPFSEALADAVRAEGLAKEPTVRSVQRLPLPPGRDAEWVAHEYARWLPGALGFVQVEVEGAVVRFQPRWMQRSLLELTFREDRSWPGRALFEITGGALVGPNAKLQRLEFRTVPDGAHVLAAVQDFRPRLPWWIYAATQAKLHVWVMWRFGRHLGRLAERGKDA